MPEDVKKKFYEVFIPAQTIQAEAWCESDAEIIASRFLKNVTAREIPEDEADEYYTRSRSPADLPVRHRKVGTEGSGV